MGIWYTVVIYARAVIEVVFVALKSPILVAQNGVVSEMKPALFQVVWTPENVFKRLKSTSVCSVDRPLQWLSQFTLRLFGKISFSFSAKPKIIQ